MYKYNMYVFLHIGIYTFRHVQIDTLLVKSLDTLIYFCFFHDYRHPSSSVK